MAESSLSSPWPRTVAVALTGASGAQYGLRLIDALIASGTRVYAMVSQAAQVVLRMELDLELPARPEETERWLTERFGARPGQLRAFGRQQWSAPVASGSNPPDAMVVCPCTMGTVASLANGLSDSLIERAGDVMLKERRPLILVVRETPFSAIHLENMLRLTQAGALIMPACPGFYHRPERVEEVVDFMVARVLDQLGVEHQLMRRWGDEAAD